MINILWLFVCIFFMISIFFFGVMIYFFIQYIKVISIKKEILSIDNKLCIIKKDIIKLLDTFQSIKNN